MDLLILAKSPVPGRVKTRLCPPLEPAEAAAVADHLVEANLVGHDSHGVIRAPKYLEWVAAGELLPGLLAG